jgi:hypothetical protein
MRDVLMIALMIASIAAFAAYVACCDRIVGRVDSDAGGRGATPASVPADELERAA